MAVQVLSDLPLEAPKACDIFEMVPRAPYLALLSDIGKESRVSLRIGGQLDRMRG